MRELTYSPLSSTIFWNTKSRHVVGSTNRQWFLERVKEKLEQIARGRQLLHQDMSYTET